MPASVHNKEHMFRRIALSGTRALPVRALFFYLGFSNRPSSKVLYIAAVFTLPHSFPSLLQVNLLLFSDAN
jgi:hypothetical protein